MEDNGASPDALQRMYLVQTTYLTKESVDKGAAFKPQPTDVIISTASKSGTTWVQQICHGLRSRGDMDFDEIGSVVPCLEMAHDAGIEDLQQPQPYTPQLFKTHFPYDICPKGAGKYIVVIRRPSDAALSLYHFLGDWYFQKSEVSLSAFITHNFLKRGEPGPLGNMSSHFQHIMGWYPHRFDENVLWLHYEDLQQDLKECVRLIAEFLQMGKDDKELMDLVLYQASFEFMKQNASKYDEHVLKSTRNRALNLPEDAGSSSACVKVRAGVSHASKSALPDYLHDKIQQKWKEVVTAQTGYETYESFRNGINKELKRSFH